jgi:hypothetical protein
VRQRIVFVEADRSFKRFARFFISAGLVVSPSEIGEHAHGKAVGNSICRINFRRPHKITHGIVGPSCMQGISPCLNVPRDLDAASRKIGQCRKANWEQEFLSVHQSYCLMRSFVTESMQRNPMHERIIVNELDGQFYSMQALRWQGRSITVDVDDSLSKGLRRFLRQVVPDAAPDRPVRILAHEFFRVRTRVGTRRTVAIALKCNRPHGDHRKLGKPLFQLIVL